MPPSQPASSVPPQGSSQTRPDHPSPQAPSPPPELINWSLIPPNGTPEAVYALLHSLSNVLRARVSLGLLFDSQPPEIYTPVGSELAKKMPDLLLTSSLVESSQAQAECIFASRSGSSSGVLDNLRDSINAYLVLGFGFQSHRTESTDAYDAGILIGIDDPNHLQPKEFYNERIEQLRTELPKWLAVWRLCSYGLETRSWRDRVAAIRGRKGKLIAAGLAVGLLCLAIPVPYRPQRECTAEPAARAYISSPVEGNIRDAAVRPGEVVSKGQVLARIDDEQIRWELSGAEAEFEAASKRRDTALATRSGGDMRLAQLEQEKISLRINALTKQLEQLSIRSPIDGIVVQGDWYHSDGAPVQRGDTLFEISPLDTMRVEAHLTTEDLSIMRQGATATAHFDSAQSKKWQGTLERIDPRGQVIDSQIVFVADMEIANPDCLLRPGMKGTLRVSAGFKSIGWLLFHRPYVWLMKKLVW